MPSLVGFDAALHPRLDWTIDSAGIAGLTPVFLDTTHHMGVVVLTNQPGVQLRQLLATAETATHVSWESTGNLEGWQWGIGDRFLAADIDGDSRDEVIVRNGGGQYLCILHGADPGYVITGFAHNSIDGWNLRQADALYPADVDGDGRAEVVVRAEGGAVPRKHRRLDSDLVRGEEDRGLEHGSE